MSNEDNTIERTENKKEPVNIWKVSLISLILLGLLIWGCISIYNSDWFINKTMAIKEGKDIELGKKIKYSYCSKYENNKLKIKFDISNADEKIINITRNYLDESEYLIKLIFNDKDGFKLAEMDLPVGKFVHSSEDKDVYYIQSSIRMEKNTIRKIKEIRPIYREILDKNYDDMQKKITNTYKKAFNNLFNF